MYRGLSILAIAIVLLSACAEKGTTRHTDEPTVTPYVTEQPSATPDSTLLPTLNPPSVPAPQLVNDLARRLSISRDEIALQRLRPVLWQKDTLQCPPLSDESIPMEHVMIVTEEGARYEPPAEGLRPGEDTALLVVLLVEERSYAYFVLNDRFLFCPND